MKKKQLQKEIAAAVANNDREKLFDLLARTDNKIISPEEAYAAMSQGLNQVRLQIMSNEASIAELLVAIEVWKAGTARLAETSGADFAAPKGKSVIIGVVAGDPHDLGKTIVASVFEANGYEIFDLGVDVPQDKFIAELKARKADILALSAMMSTTMVQIAPIAAEAKKVKPDVTVLAGGAAMDADLARKFGADGYAESALTLIEETEKALR